MVRLGVIVVGYLTLIGCGRGPHLAERPSARNQPDQNSPRFESSPLAKVVGHPTGESMFEEVPAAYSGIDFSKRSPNAEKYIRELFFLSVHGGICTGDVDQDGLADVYVP